MYDVRLTRGDNGYRLSWSEEAEDDSRVPHEEYIQDDEADELKSVRELLWWILEWAGHSGSKHDPERIRIVTERQDGTVKEE